MKILVVDDDATNRMLLSAYLKKEGHKTIAAVNGLDAVEKFKQTKPELVLMDVIMPEMDGYQATTIIKEISEKFTPIIFLTAMSDEEGLAKCVAAGGDDFLTKPYSRVILNAKINAFSRVSKLYNRIYNQNEVLEAYQEQTEQEQKYAKNVFNTLVQQSFFDEKLFDTHISPVSLFNGDVVLSSLNPLGIFNICLGDFTGHGLGASLGALPLSNIFYTMTEKGFHVEDIVREINSKLKKQLPTGIFFAACLIELDPVNGIIKVWNGAIPGAYLLRKTGELVQIPSRHPPLTIFNKNEFDHTCEIFEIYQGDKIVLTTDGILESENKNREMYGTQRFEDSLKKHHDNPDLITQILVDRDKFVGETEANDDNTLILLNIDFEYIKQIYLDHGADKEVINTPWSLEFKLLNNSIQKIDPMPILNQIIKSTLGERHNFSRLNMVLTELFCNALDHGLLGLNSSLKATPTGFMEFYEQKQQKLASLEKGELSFHLVNNPVENEDHSLLQITISDSGEGFDVSNMLEKSNCNIDQQLEQNSGFCGRGYPLIKKYVESIEYNDKGNEVRCIFKY